MNSSKRESDCKIQQGTALLQVRTEVWGGGGGGRCVYVHVCAVLVCICLVTCVWVDVCSGTDDYVVVQMIGRYVCGV